MQWDHGARATPNAQLSFFAEFLATTGVYDSWVNSCPLSYSSPNAPSKRDVLGTWLLAILSGHKRYARITGLGGDAVSPQILGTNKIISEDALRRALSRMKAEQSQAWLAPQLLTSVQAALSTPWILETDAGPQRPRLERSPRHTQTLRLEQVTPGGGLPPCCQNRFGAEPQNQHRVRSAD